MGAEIGQVSIEIEARTDEVKRSDRIVLDWYFLHTLLRARVHTILLTIIVYAKESLSPGAAGPTFYLLPENWREGRLNS